MYFLTLDIDKARARTQWCNPDITVLNVKLRISQTYRKTNIRFFSNLNLQYLPSFFQFIQNTTMYSSVVTVLDVYK